MPYNIVAVRTAAETSARLYPVLADTVSAYLVGMEEADGTNVRPFRATGLTVFEVKNNQHSAIGTLRDTALEVYLTDARVIVACAKISKGNARRRGDDTGASGMTLAGTGNAVGRAPAARRSRGECLVGHIRYPWLVQIGATARTGIRTHNALRLEIRDKTPSGLRTLLLEIILDKRAEAPAIAQQIARRCARYHLDHDIAPGNKHHAAYQTLAGASALTSERGNYAFYVMPTYYFISSATAHLARAGAGVGVGAHP